LRYDRPLTSGHSTGFPGKPPWTPDTPRSIVNAGIVRAAPLLVLPECVQMRVEARLMESSAADEVGRLDDSDEQDSRAERIIVEKLTRDLEITAIQPQKPGPASTVKAGQARAPAR
jgi:hypothetical protein